MNGTGVGKTIPPSLIERARRGESGAFEELYRTLFTPVYRYVAARIGDRNLAEDIVQTTFLKAYQALDRFEERGVDPRAYLLTIARNTVIDHWKKRTEVAFADTDAVDGEGEPERDAIPDPAASASDVIDRALLRNDLRTALLLLTADQRDVLSLKFFAERTTEEIARELEKSPEAIRQLQSRGLKVLREHLAGAPWTCPR
ncbi:MAG: sigma-70 family RNA polymerase sigma factor [bacterium]|nr:sigma-70 family RNA polymerase sigma factor [bacterium]